MERVGELARPWARRGEPSAWLTVAGVVLIAFNMRAALVATGPLMPDIRHDLELSRGAVSLLTTLPLVCFGLLATGTVVLGRRIGSERTL
ncbi:MAG: MFS transporter, partial [Actinophytocola sp.]|nr:MFS transporter [Actinophytocola sp.]